jgi:2'-5' RNA ligase
MERDRSTRLEARPWRLFVAADIPEGIRKELDHDLASLRVAHPEARWVPPENWHVTLKFLGAVEPRHVEDLRSTVARTAEQYDAFETRLASVGAFPNERRARVVWAGLDDRSGTLGALANGLDQVLARFVEPEQRPFSPHLTVARLRNPASVEAALARGVAISSTPFAVDGIVLYRSHLRRPAPLYEAVQEFPLAQGR